MTYRLRNILIAVVLALLAALLTSLYVTNYERNVKDDAKPETVFVATKDVPPGTAAEDVLSSFKEKKIPHGDVVGGAIADREDVRGKVSTQWIFSDEQVTVRRFADVGEGGVRSELKGNLRAFQVNGDQNQVLAGTLKKGDRVDVVAAFTYKTNNSQSYTASRVVLRDILVLQAPSSPAVGGKLASGLNDKFPVMLQLTDAQAPKLEFVITTVKDSDASNSVVGWSLALRAVAKAEDSPESVQTLDTMLLDGLSRRQRDLLLGKFGAE